LPYFDMGQFPVQTKQKVLVRWPIQLFDF